MTWFLVSWIAYSCPGGLFGKLVPEAVRPIVCELAVETEIHSDKQRAYRAVAKAGCAARPTISWCKGLKCHAKKVTCPTELHIEGEKIK